MDTTSWVLLVMLISENLSLLMVFLIWFFRKCSNCKDIKKISELFNKYCDKCDIKKNGNSKKLSKQVTSWT